MTVKIQKQIRDIEISLTLIVRVLTLMLLSVLCGNLFAIFVHWLPYIFCNCTIILSSSSVQLPIHHKRRQEVMSTQDTIIHLCTKRRKMKYFVHRLHEKSRINRLILIELLRRRITFGYLPFLRLLSRWLYHLSRHCLPVLGAKLAANFVQFFVLCVLTNSRSF